MSYICVADEQKPLSGWSVYSNDPDFKIKKLKNLGVEDRQDVIQKINQENKKLFIFEKCDRLIWELFPKNNMTVQEKREFCDRALNLKDYLFYTIYRPAFTEENLIKFRGKINELFP